MLLRKGNAVVVEWLRSPLVYRETGPVAEQMRDLADHFSDPQNSVRHYYGLVRGQWSREFEGRSHVRLKKYLYAIRSASALLWLRDQGSIPPMDLPSLLAGAEIAPPVRAEVDRLLEIKRVSHELGEGDRIPLLDAFIEAAMGWARGSGALRPMRPSLGFLHATDELFRRAVAG